MSQLAALLRKLEKVNWRWTTAELSAMVSTLELEERGTQDQRRTYITRTGLELVVYLSNGNVDAIEVELDVFEGTEELDDSEYEDKVDEFFAKFEAAVAEAQKVLGPPRFNNGFGTRGFPLDQDAVWLALWDIDNARLMIQQTNEGRDMPFRLLIVVAPQVSRARRNRN